MTTIATRRIAGVAIKRDRERKKRGRKEYRGKSNDGNILSPRSFIRAAAAAYSALTRKLSEACSSFAIRGFVVEWLEIKGDPLLFRAAVE